jgi:hypothetical protein
MELNINVEKSFFECILRLIFLNLQKMKRNRNPNEPRHQTVIGVGISINLPKTPEVLMKTVAKRSVKR